MPSKKVDKEQIIKASVSLIRKDIPLSARNIAKELNCSTQPIYYLYKNMLELENDLYIEAKNIFDKYKNKYFLDSTITKYKAMGLAFVDFASSEKGLFKHFYLDNRQNKFTMTLQDDTMEELKKACKINKEDAQKFDLNMSVYTLGLVMLRYFNESISMQDVSALLTEQYTALINIYKKRGT